MHRAAAWLLLLAALACAAHGFEAVRPKREDADAGAAKAARRSERGPDEIEQGNVAADATRGARGPPSAAAADTEGVFVYTVEHAIGSAPFSLRGKCVGLRAPSVCVSAAAADAHSRSLLRVRVSARVG
jgi:hypothetical protein